MNRRQQKPLFFRYFIHKQKVKIEIIFKKLEINAKKKAITKNNEGKKAEMKTLKMGL